MEGDRSQLPVLLPQHSGHSGFRLRFLRRISSGTAGQPQTRPEEVKLEDNPDEAEINQDVGEGEHHPGAEGEGVARVAGHEVHQNEVGRSSNDGAGTADVSRVSHAEMRTSSSQEVKG